MISQCSCLNKQLRSSEFFLHTSICNADFSENARLVPALASKCIFIIWSAYCVLKFEERWSKSEPDSPFAKCFIFKNMFTWEVAKVLLSFFISWNISNASWFVFNFHRIFSVCFFYSNFLLTPSVLQLRVDNKDRKEKKINNRGLLSSCHFALKWLRIYSAFLVQKRWEFESYRELIFYLSSTLNRWPVMFW